MIKVGLTGPSGAGKGMFSELLESYGIHTLDTDEVSREVCGVGMPCTKELGDAFGRDIIRDDGTLDRKLLAKKVFLAEDKNEKIAKLNEITHKYILAKADEWLKVRECCGDAAAVIDAPVLFESGYDKKCDYIIGVIADYETRVERVMKRDKIERELAEKRVRAQQNDDFYYRNCSVVIRNDSDRTALEEKTKKIAGALVRGEIPK